VLVFHAACGDENECGGLPKPSHPKKKRFESQPRPAAGAHFFLFLDGKFWEIAQARQSAMRARIGMGWEKSE